MGALALTLAVSGALALRTFSRTNAYASDSSDLIGYVGITEAEVSSDVKAVMDSFVGSGGITKIEYVKDYAVQNADGGTSGTVSGIRLNLKGTMSASGYPNSIYPRSSMAIDATKLDYNDKLLGFVIDNKNHYAKDDANRIRMVAPYISTDPADQKGTIAYLWINPMDADTADTPLAAIRVRTYSEANKSDASGFYYEGIYSADSGMNISQQRRAISLNGYTSVPFNIYYDYGDNALCADGMTESDGKLVKFLSLPNDKYSAVPVNPAVSSEAEYKNSSSIVAKYDFKPNDDGTLYLGFRVDVGSENQGIILTSFAGLDLTNPAAAYTEKQIESVSVKVDGADEANAGKEYTIPEVKFAIDEAKEFNGTVDVFEGSSSAVAPGPVVKAEFISKNYVKVAENKAVGDTVTLGAGNYLLVYNDADGNKYVLKVNSMLVADLKLIGTGAFKFVDLVTNETVAADTVLTIDGDYKIVVMANDGYLDAVILRNNDDADNPVETALIPNMGGVVTIDFITLAQSGKLGVNNELVATVRNYYTVNFVSFGETVKTAEVKQGDVIPFPETAPVKKGYTFLGWLNGNDVLSAGATLPYAGEDTDMTVNLVAKNSLNQYTATLKLPAAHAGIATLNAESGVFTMISDIDFAAPSVADGFKFGGWFYNGKKVTKGEELPAENVELYAYISKDVVTVTFMHDTEIVDTAEVLKGKKAFASAYTVDGYVLKGWFTDKAGTTAFDFDSALTADVTLYGVFVKLGDNTTVGSDVATVKSEARVLNNTNVKALNLISAKGLVTLIIAIVGLAGTAAFATLIVLGLNKKPARINDETDGESSDNADGESIEK